VILEEGSLTAHVTIVARAMGVPVLGRVRDVRRLIAEGDLLLCTHSREHRGVYRLMTESKESSQKPNERRNP